MNIIINKDEILGKGVDGIIYKATINNLSIVVKIMVNIMTREELDEFIKINKIADKLNIGPKIYDIQVKDNEIYIFMEKLEYDLSKYIEKKIEEGKNIEWIKNKIKILISPIHKIMKRNNITIGDKTIDNYMFINSTIKKIDYTKSHLKKILNTKDIKDYNVIYIYNYITKTIEPVFLSL
jgi:hypothetical protein